MHGCTLNSSVQVLTPTTSFSRYSYIACEHLGAAGTNKTFYRFGTISRDTADARGGSGECMKMTPNIAANSSGAKLTPHNSFLFAVQSGVARTITVYMKKDSSYNGNDPGLTLKFLGHVITGRTAVSMTTSYVQQSIVASAGDITEDGVVELIVDCDGTAGNIFIDDLD
jgi:hypothetical protein